jgi:preprotein translocase subunit YajC
MFGVLDLIGASCIYFFKKNLYLIDFVSNYVCVCVRERKRERERERVQMCMCRGMNVLVRGGCHPLLKVAFPGR